MDEKIIEINKKIVNVGTDPFSEYELKELYSLDFDLFVYSYKDGGYDGTGFSAWRNGDKYFYHELGHCSCDGPTAGISISGNAPYTLEQVEEIAKKGYTEEYSTPVIEYLRTH